MLVAQLLAMPEATRAEPVAAASPFPAPAPVVPGPELVAAFASEILAAVRTTAAKVTLVNLWATWCTPCRQEFPDLLRFAEQWRDRGVALVLVSGDFATESDTARDFLASQGVRNRCWLKNQKDEDFINAFDPAWSGALPATFVYDSAGTRKHSFLGPITYESLEREVAPMLGANP